MQIEEWLKCQHRQEAWNKLTKAANITNKEDYQKIMQLTSTNWLMISNRKREEIKATAKGLIAANVIIQKR